MSEHLSTADTAKHENQINSKKATPHFYSYSLAGSRVHTKHHLPPFQYKVANTRRPVYLLILLTAQSKIRTTDSDRLYSPPKYEMVCYGERTYQIIFFHTTLRHHSFSNKYSKTTMITEKQTVAQTEQTFQHQ